MKIDAINQPFLRLFLVIMGAPATVHAYLDPGTGSLIFQTGFAMISLLLGGLLIPFKWVKNFFLRCSEFFKR